MKKKMWIIPLVGFIVMLAVLFVPIPQASYDDGGTREYIALTYKIVDWNVLQEDGVYEKTRIYFGSKRNMSYSELWELEQGKPEDVGDMRHKAYDGQWLDKNTAVKIDSNIFDDIRITEIYSDCFFAKTVIPLPYTIKLNGTLSDEWCVGDHVLCTYENVYRDQESGNVEADMLTIEASDFELEPGVAYKPVIYLYPEEKTDVSVKLTLNGELTCTYPAYRDGWNVTAFPDGRLTDKEGQSYNYLYWEGEINADYDMSRGFCIKGEDTAAFLEASLEKLGLNRREANEFIVYWLPQMEKNEYNIISFCTDEYTDAANLCVAPSPDTVIRVFMAWKKAEAFTPISAQELSASERNGFTVVEWGGTEIK